MFLLDNWVKKPPKSRIFSIFLVFLLFTSISYNFPAANAEIAQTSVQLVLKTTGGGPFVDYANSISEYLTNIGIEVDVLVEDYTTFMNTLLVTHDYDLAITSLSGEIWDSPDLRDLYTENGSFNMFGLSSDIPSNNESEQMQEDGLSITNPSSRKTLYYNWQEFIMEDIIPMLPLYTPRSYDVIWSNILGFDTRWGIVNSLPYMSYSGFHEGQDSLDEFSIADSMWSELNPLFQDDTSSKFLSSLISEPLLQLNLDKEPIKTGIIQDWDKIDDFHYKFHLMPDIYWSPSYNVTERTHNSIPLSSIPDGDLMKGLKNAEYSNGTNQKILAKDAVFTLLAWANSVVSEDSSDYQWISDIYVDPVDELAFHIHIDENPNDPELDYYLDFWLDLRLNLLPEFFLNSTDSTITYTSGNVTCRGLYPSIIDTIQWKAFSDSPFGCGQYSLNYYVKNSVAVFEKNPFWHGKGAIDGSTGKEPFVDNFFVRVIPDLSAQLAEFKSGKLDFMNMDAFPSERKQMQADPRFQVMTSLDDSMSFLIFNLQRPIIGGDYHFENILDPEKNQTSRALGIRKAICHAINREEMNTIVNGGDYFISHNVISPTSPYYYTLTDAKYNYNQDLAQEWLTAALGLPEYTIYVENDDFTLNPINITINCSSILNSSGCTLKYQVNGGSFITLAMSKLNDSFFSCNITKDFNANVTLSFYIEMVNEYGEIRITSTSMIESIISEDLVTFAEFNINKMINIIIIASLIIIPISMKLKRKRRVF